MAFKNRITHKVRQVILMAVYQGSHPTETLTVTCRQVSEVAAEYHPDGMTIKEPPSLLIEGISPAAILSLPFNPTRLSFQDAQGRIKLFRVMRKPTRQPDALCLSVGELHPAVVPSSPEREDRTIHW